MFVSCHLIMGSSNVERSLSLAQYGFRVEICPSSCHDYHSIYMANDDQGCCVRPWWNLRIILSSDIHHEECAFLMRYSRSSEEILIAPFSPQWEYSRTFFELLSEVPVVLSRSVALLLQNHATSCIRYHCSSGACMSMV